MACVSARRRAPPRPPPFTADFDAAAARAAADRVASRRLARGPPPSTIHAVQRGRSPQRKQAEARAAARHAAEAACATEDALYDTEPTVWGSETVHGAHLVLPPPDAPRRPAGAARTGRTWRDVDALARAWERYAADTAIVRLVERSAAALPPYAAAAHAITELRLAAAETIMAGAPRRAPQPQAGARAARASGSPSLSYYSGPVTLRLCGLSKVGGGGTPVGVGAVLATLVATVLDGVIVDVVDYSTGRSVLESNGSGSGLPTADAYMLLDSNGVNLHVTATLGSVLQVNFNDWSQVFNLSVTDDVPYLTTANGSYLLDVLYEVVGTPEALAAAAAAQDAHNCAWTFDWTWIVVLLLLLAAATLVLAPSWAPAGDGDA